MDEYADIYYVDDNRNAVVTNDHRTGSTGISGRSPWPFPRPPVTVGPGSQPARTVYIASPQSQVRPSVPMQPQVIYAPPAPPWYPQNQSAAATLFGKLTTGQVVEMVAQIFAALQSLPAAPVATREASTDVANLILFQNALAQHAKRDEQVRTLGSLVAKLVG